MFFCHVSLCYVSLVQDICCVLMWVLFHGVLQCGLLRIVFICWDIVLFGGMACVGMEGQSDFIYKHLLLCMLHYYGVILHALILTFTYYLLLYTYSIYSLVPYLSCHIYTLNFV